MLRSCADWEISQSADPSGWSFLSPTILLPGVSSHRACFVCALHVINIIHKRVEIPKLHSIRRCVNYVIRSQLLLTVLLPVGKWLEFWNSCKMHRKWLICRRRELIIAAENINVFSTIIHQWYFVKDFLKWPTVCLMAINQLTLLVIDDLVYETNQLVADIFTKISHHCND